MNFFINLNFNLFIIFLLINFINSYAPKLILLSFDAFRADYLHPKLTPNMYQLSKEGVSTRKMKSCYVTKTFPNHFSISTGLYEENHGIIGNFMFDPDLNDTFYMTNTDEKWWASESVKPIWNLNQQFSDDRKSGVFMWPGSTIVYDNQLPEYNQDFNKVMPWEDRIDTIVEWMTKDVDPANFVLAYFNEPDVTSHHYGPFSPEVKNVLIQIDKIVLYLKKKLKEASILDETNLIIISDHGMSEINNKQVVELENIIDKNEIKIYGTSPNLNILVKDPTNIDKVYNQLKSAEAKNHYSVYKREDVPKHYHYNNHKRILDIVIEADDGYEITMSYKQNKNLNENSSQDEDSNNSKEPITDIIEKFEDFERRSKVSKLKYWGNHGFNNSLPNMKPLFLAHGPAFKKNYIHRKPFLNLDLYSLMCSVLHLNLNDNLDKHCVEDGEPSRVNGMLKKLIFTSNSVNKENELATDNLPFISFLLLGFCLLVFFGCLFTIFTSIINSNYKRKRIININLDEDVVDIDLALHIQNKTRFNNYKKCEETELLIENNFPYS